MDLLVAVLLLTCFGCGKGGAAKQLLPEPTTLPTVHTKPSPAPLTLPNPSELEKSVVYLEADRAREGAAFETAPQFSFANLTTSGQLGVYRPQWTSEPGMSLTDLAYGIYSFALPGYDQTGTIYTSWMDGIAPRDGQGWYLGLADFNRDAWHWFTGTANGVVPVGDFSAFLSTNGVSLVVVVVLGTAECQLERIRIGGNILPEVDLQVDTTYGPPALTVNFDASASVDHDGEIVLFSWDFDGDGTPDEEGATATQVEHTYSTSGDYPATLTVTDAEEGATEVVVDIFVNLPPTASLSADPLIGSAPLTVAFNAGDSTDPEGQITNIQWDFDGDSVFNEAGFEQDYEGQAIADYIFNSRGLYTPGVKIIDHHDEESIATVEVSVNSPPNAVLSASPLVGQVPIDVSFNGSLSTDSDGTIEDFEWDFNGNGAFNETGGEADSRGNPSPVYNYTVQSGYNATLRVTDNDGGQASASQFIELGGPWEHTWGLSGDEKFYGVAADSTGNVYATGELANPDSKILLAKFGPSGSLVWKKSWQPETPSLPCYGRGIAVDASGNVYVTGHMVVREDGRDDDLLLLKFDSEGSFVWARSWGGDYYYLEQYDPLLEILEITRKEYGVDLAIGADGDVFVTGHAYYKEWYWVNTTTPPYYYERIEIVTTMFLVKFDGDGNLAFQRDYYLGNYARGEGIALDNANDLAYCTGVGLVSGQEDVLVVAWDQTGTFQQAFRWGGSSPDHAWGICVDAAGKIVVTGETRSFGLGGYDAFVWQAESFSNADPELIWQRSWGGTGTDAAVGVCWDIATSQFVVGGLTNSVGLGGFDMFALAFSDTGTLNNQLAWGTASDELCLRVSQNSEYGLPLAVGIAPRTTDASWTDVSGTSSDISGDWVRRVGAKLDVAYDTVVVNGSLASLGGVLDTGGGGEDALVLQFMP